MDQSSILIHHSEIYQRTSDDVTTRAREGQTQIGLIGKTNISLYKRILPRGICILLVESMPNFGDRS